MGMAPEDIEGSCVPSRLGGIEALFSAGLAILFSLFSAGYFSYFSYFILALFSVLASRQ
jgi:hypothetical protein